MATIKETLAAAKVLEKIINAKGRFVKAAWKSNPKPAAAYKSSVVLEKHTVGVVQAGIEFQNLSAVKDAIAAGERGEVQPLPWGQWSVYPYIIEHKEAEYIRLYPSGGFGHVPKTTYYVNGDVVEKSKFAEYLTPSEAQKLIGGGDEDRPLCFTIKAENIMGLPEDLIEG
jgi:hypothetical protein